MEKLSVIVITLNEERNIERCLRSVQWADEIIVVDAFSSDMTVEICQRSKATVLQKKWEGFAAQKQFALSSAAHSWVLSLDADEEVPPELRQEIQSILSSTPVSNGFNVARMSFFLGQWMKHGGWYPGYQLRLFRKSQAVVIHRAVHEGFEVSGSIGTLNNPMLHYTYHSIEQYLSKVNEYTSLDVLNKLEEGRKRRVRWYNFIINPASEFVRMYFSLGGFNDGFRGLLLAIYSSLYKLLLYAKTWEFQTAELRKQPPPPITIAALNDMKRFD